MIISFSTWQAGYECVSSPQKECFGSLFGGDISGSSFIQTCCTDHLGTGGGRPYCHWGSVSIQDNKARSRGHPHGILFFPLRGCFIFNASSPMLPPWIGYVPSSRLSWFLVLSLPAILVDLSCFSAVCAQ